MGVPHLILSELVVEGPPPPSLVWACLFSFFLSLSDRSSRIVSDRLCLHQLPVRTSLAETSSSEDVSRVA